MSMNMNEMLKKARRIQTEMEKDEQKIQKKEFTIEKQGITVVMNGLRKLVSIKFNPALIDPDDPELLEDLLMLAVNEAIETVDKAFDEINAKYSDSGLSF